MGWGLGLGYLADVPHRPVEIERRRLSESIVSRKTLAECLVLRYLSGQLLRKLGW